MKAFGTYRLPVEITERVVQTAIDYGITHIDTAQLYKNDTETIKAVQQHSHVTLTTKIHFDLIRESARDNRSIETSLQLLSGISTDRVSVLLHAPIENFTIAWEQLKRTPYRIGVSNFSSVDLELLSSLPTVNQIEATPFNPCTKTIDYCVSHNIHIETHSTLCKGKTLSHYDLAQFAFTHKLTPAQVLFGWSLCRDYTAIFSSKKPEHIAELAHVYDISECLDFRTETRFRTHKYILE